MKRCFQIHAADNVATLLDDSGAEEIAILGAASGTLRLREPVSLGHKAALGDIRPGECVVKYGVPIGLASLEIRRGAWVHTHNCRSRFDEQGAAHITAYE